MIRKITLAACLAALATPAFSTVIDFDSTPTGTLLDSTTNSTTINGATFTLCGSITLTNACVPLTGASPGNSASLAYVTAWNFFSVPEPGHVSGNDLAINS